MTMVATGHGNYVPRDRIVSVMAFQENLKDTIEAAKRQFRYMDHTGGRVPRSVLLLDSGYIAVTSVRPDTLALRINDPSHDGFDD